MSKSSRPVVNAATPAKGQLPVARKPYSAPLSEAEIAEEAAFCVLHGKWMAARAVIAAGIEDDEAWNEHQDELEKNEIELLFTPAATEQMFWRKWEVLEVAVDSEHRVGVSDPARLVRATAAIKLDLMRFGFKGS
jgi:hypothetical protein